jgi:hypothetical protein
VRWWHGGASVGGNLKQGVGAISLLSFFLFFSSPLPLLSPLLSLLWFLNVRNESGGGERGWWCCVGVGVWCE